MFIPIYIGRDNDTNLEIGVDDQGIYLADCELGIITYLTPAQCNALIAALTEACKAFTHSNPR